MDCPACKGSMYLAEQDTEGRRLWICEDSDCGVEVQDEA